jgi:hypothetical protein
VFDNLFELYNHRRNDADALSVVAWAVLMVTVTLEVVVHPKVGLRVSQVGCAFAMLVMWVQMVLPASPNYLHGARYVLTEICARGMHFLSTHLLGCNPTYGYVCFNNVHLSFSSLTTTNHAHHHTPPQKSAALQRNRFVLCA